MQKLPAHNSKYLIQIIRKLGNRELLYLESEQFPDLIIRNLDQQIEYCGNTYQCYELNHDVSYEEMHEQITMRFMVCLHPSTKVRNFINKVFPYYLDLYPCEENNKPTYGLNICRFGSVNVLQTTADQEEQVDAAIMLLTLLKFRGY